MDLVKKSYYNMPDVMKPDVIGSDIYYRAINVIRLNLV